MNVPELIQLSSNYWNSCTLHAGVKLDIFTSLVDTSYPVPELARCISVDQQGLEMLLHALTAMNLLQNDGETFKNTPFSAQYLCKTSPDYMGHIILHHHHLVEGWSRLDEAVKHGGPVRRRSSHEVSEKERESFLMGMFNLASLIAPGIAGHIDLSGRRRLLDLAGGPGTYAIQFCKQNPDLTAVVYDLPTTRPFAEQTITQFGMSERIRFAAGDITSDNLGTGYDVIWISHLLHSENFKNSAAIVHKAAHSLNPGGLLLIQEFILDDDKNAPLFPALFSLNMLVGTPDGQAYSHRELFSIMADAGLTAIKRLSLDLPNGAGVMVGMLPDV